MDVDAVSRGVGAVVGLVELARDSGQQVLLAGTGGSTITGHYKSGYRPQRRCATAFQNPPVPFVMILRT